MYTFKFSRRDNPSNSWTSVLLENQITSEYDENLRESTHLRQLIPSMELARFIRSIILLFRFVSVRVIFSRFCVIDFY